MFFFEWFQIIISEFSYYTLSSKNSSKSGLNQATEMFRPILESWDKERNKIEYNLGACELSKGLKNGPKVGRQDGNVCSPHL